MFQAIFKLRLKGKVLKKTGNINDTFGNHGIAEIYLYLPLKKRKVYETVISFRHWTEVSVRP